MEPAFKRQDKQRQDKLEPPKRLRGTETKAASAELAPEH
jgi:hypothetical protein